MVKVFLIGCAALLVVGCAAMRAEASEKEQTHSDRCEGTRTIRRLSAYYLTNDLPGCPNKGGLLSAQLPQTGRNKISIPKYYGLLRGQKGDDEILGSSITGDEIYGGGGNDIIYGGPGDDTWLSGDDGDDVIYGGDADDGNGEYQMSGGPGEDVLNGGDGNDFLNGDGDGGQRDKLYCGEGRDYYFADKNDYVDS